jgi:hypothetical protein
MILVVGAAWLVAFFVIAGLGQWIRLVCRVPGERGGWLQAFWVGYAALIAILQVHWLFGPITWVSTAAIALVGAAGAVIAGLRVVRRSVMAGRTSPSHRLIPPLTALCCAVVLALIGAWVASRALDPRIDFDSQFYHISAIRWRNEYPAIVGLGNLHYRLAFNQSFFLFCAWLNVFPAFGHGYTLANSLLLMVTAATCLAPLSGALVRFAVRGAPTPARSNSLIPILASALCLPIVVFRAVPQPYSFNISGPSPDLGVYLFQIVIALATLDLLCGRSDSPAEDRCLLILIGALSAASITQKLSAAAFAGVVIIGVGLWWWQGRRRTRQSTRHSAIEAAGLLGLATLPVMVPWLLIGLVTSGYPAFPNTFGALPVDYRIPLETTIEARDWIYSWARYPVSSANAADVLSGWSWLPLWLRLLFSDPTELFLFVIPVLLFAALMAAWAAKLIVKVIGRRRAYPRAAWAVIVPALIGGLFWWITAPDPRFAGAVFWLLAIGAGLMLIGSGRRLVAVVSLGALSVTGWIVVDGYANSYETRDAFPTIYSEPVAPFTTEFGFTYNVSADPDRNLQMGDPPLPSSVYRIPGVALRGATLLEGLVTRPTQPPAPPDRASVRQRVRGDSP